MASVHAASPADPATAQPFGDLKLSRCRHGWMLHAGPYIGKCFELYGEYSEAEVDVMRAYVRPGDCALDVGANIGDLTLPLAALVEPEGRVYAVESNPATFNVLCANLALNAIEHVKPLNVFIADSSDVDTGSAQWGPDAYTGGIWAPSFMAIDDLDLPRCSFIKVDVDGKELEVLRSARRTIERCAPVLYFENDIRERSSELLAHVLAQGYRLYAHVAPIFRPDNFLQNPVNAWPQAIASLMVLALPPSCRDAPLPLPEISGADFWWDRIGVS